MHQKFTLKLKNSCLLAVMVLTVQYGQATTISPKNAHSHNDYLQGQPFYNAYRSGFASMEIDVFQVGPARKIS